jgi:hypothetical protein
MLLVPNGDNGRQLLANLYSVESTGGGDAVFQNGVENTGGRKSGLVAIY